MAYKMCSIASLLLLGFSNKTINEKQCIYQRCTAHERHIIASLPPPGFSNKNINETVELPLGQPMKAVRKLYV